MNSAVKTKARTTNDHASFRVGNSLLKNSMEADAVMELALHLEEN
jgi:hypothetical protein